MWKGTVLLLALALFGSAMAHADPLPKVPVPESAFLSHAQYTNVFFGFRLPLPEKHFQVVDLSDSNKALQHFLFAEKSGDRGITLLVLSATQVFGNPDQEAQKMDFLPGQQASNGPEALSIGGRLFWKNESEQKTPSGKVYRLRYTTALRGYVLVVAVSSQSSRLTDDLRQQIESIKFFDPNTAKQVAGSDGQPYLTDAVRRRLQNAPQLDLTRLDAGHISKNVYSNQFFGFSYHFPAGWFVADANGELPLGRAAGPKRAAAQTAEQSADTLQCTRVLSQATEKPQTPDVDGFSPRILILAADPGCFVPDVKFPESIHDTDAIQLFGETLARAFAGTPFLGRNAGRLIAADLDGHLFLEMPSLSAVPISGSALLRKIHMSFVITSLKQYWVIWLMESDTESQLSRLMKTSIAFAPSTATSQ